MRDGKVFIDTNVIVYAYDISAGEKHSKAVEIIKGLWDTGSGITSTQVLQEFLSRIELGTTHPIY